MVKKLKKFIKKSFGVSNSSNTTIQGLAPENDNFPILQVSNTHAQWYYVKMSPNERRTESSRSTSEDSYKKSDDESTFYFTSDMEQIIKIIYKALGKPKSPSTNEATYTYLAELLAVLQDTYNATRQTVNVINLNNNTKNQSSIVAKFADFDQRKIVLKCRRAMLYCWKYMITELNENQSLVAEVKEIFFELIGLISERREYNLEVKEGDLRNSGQNFNSPHQHLELYLYGVQIKNVKLPKVEKKAMEDDRQDCYFYRCLLIATFKYVAGEIDAVEQKKRSYLSYIELNFFARVLAVCFLRIPIVQQNIIPYIQEMDKEWVFKTRCATFMPRHNSGATSPPSHLQFSGAQSPDIQNTFLDFATSLEIWNEDGDNYLLTDNQNESSRTIMGTCSQRDRGSRYNKNRFSVIEGFRGANPTLFEWFRFNPYLGSSPNDGIFCVPNITKEDSWLKRLGEDGEFYMLFMGWYSEHAMRVAPCLYQDTFLWNEVPGYSTLIRVALLILKEAAWQKWISIQDGENKVTHPERNISSQNFRVPFQLKHVRSVRTVFEEILKVYNNADILETCVLAMLECTNVYSSRSVTFSLSRIEEWFALTVVEKSGKCGARSTYQLPSTLNGQAFALSIRIMLSSDNFEVLKRVLLFLYNCIDYFHGTLRNTILKCIVQKHMLLFLHWNENVRECYHHLLVYRIVRVNRFLIESPIDQLLIGKHALPLHLTERSSDFGLSHTTYHDSHLFLQHSDGHASILVGKDPSEVKFIRSEQNIWLAFDACLGAICVSERINAAACKSAYKASMECVKFRSIAFKHLNKNSTSHLTNTDGKSQFSDLTANEGLPGGKPWRELMQLEHDLSRETPYYLRYLPPEDNTNLDELQAMASNVKYPPHLQVYASAALEHYSELLQRYYAELYDKGVVNPPILEL